MSRRLFAGLVFCLLLGGAFAQSAPPAAAPAAQPAGTLSARTLRLGPGDEVDISVYNVPELTQHARITGTGEVYLPLIGYVRVEGMTVEQAQAAIEKQLSSGNYVKNPHVSVFVKDFSSETISIAGEVAKPGAYPAMQAHRLLDLIQAAGGLTQRAGRNVTIAHRDTPSKTESVRLSDNAVETAQSNVDLRPGDTVVIDRAGVVYVLGEVNRPGGFVIDEQQGMTLMRVVAMANGPANGASLSKARILRSKPDGTWTEMAVPLKDLLHAKAADIPMQADDILYVPSSRRKGMSPGAIASTLATTIIYRVPL